MKFSTFLKSECPKTKVFWSQLQSMLGGHCCHVHSGVAESPGLLLREKLGEFQSLQSLRMGFETQLAVIFRDAAITHHDHGEKM